MQVDSGPAAVLEYAAIFRDAVIARARGHIGDGQTDEVAFREEAFTELFIDALADAGAVSEGHVCHFERRIGHSVARADGYYVDEEENERLDVFISIYRGGDVPEVISREDVVRAVKQALHFVETARKGIHGQMEPADVAYSMVQRVHELRSQIREVRVFVLTDGLAKELRSKKGVRLPGLPHTVHLWDVERLSRCAATGGVREPIEVDFATEFGEPLACLPAHAADGEYNSYLVIFPGTILYRLYDDYGERLLELNVRSFLQARGKINKEIRKTILEAPQDFFAYNNGLSLVAEAVRTVERHDGGLGIAWLRGVQIVNGGQTTASIHRAGKKDRAEEKLRSISVQAKLSVIEPARVEEMVPRISHYANSQNKVNEADFSANHPFHQQLERVSRSMWTPNGLSHWFYERARGQYQVARARDGRTAAALKKFDVINPSSQMFTKTDLATFEHSWEQMPHLVSRGSQKNFREFTLRLCALEPPPVPDSAYFKRLVAKAIIFKCAQAAARQQQVGAYRANIVTFAVAYLASRLGDSIDLGEIWDRQSVSPAIDAVIRGLIGPVGVQIVESAGQRNVTEWCKHEECWTAMHALEFMPGCGSTLGRVQG